MDPFVIAAVVAIAGFPVWKLRKDQEPAILREVARLGIHAELDRPTAACRADDYEMMAHAIDIGQRFVGRSEQPAPDELRHAQIGYHYGSPSQPRA